MILILGAVSCDIYNTIHAMLVCVVAKGGKVMFESMRRRELSDHSFEEERNSCRNEHVFSEVHCVGHTFKEDSYR